MYGGSIPYYDRINAGKDYAREVRRLRALIEERRPQGATRLLDVACGTGRHLELLAPGYDVEGLDLDPAFLEVARARLPGTPLHQGSMVDFDLGTTFHVVTCLFSSIGYLTTLEEVRQAAATFYRHLEPGGIVLVEPWFTPDAWRPGTCHAVFVDDPELKIARVNTSYQDGRLSRFDLHYLIGTPEATEHIVERHEMGLFETDEILAAFHTAGFTVAFDPEGLIGRGLLIGTRREDDPTV